MTDSPGRDLPTRRSETTLVALRQRRERTIEVLCEHFARDHLETNELVELIDRAHAATSIAELDALLQDLPALATPQPLDRPAASPAPVGRRREHQPLVAVMGGVERKGRWTPAEQVYAEARTLAATYAKGPTIALRAAKLAINRGLEMSLGDGLVFEREQLASLFATEDQKRGMRSFLEKGPGQAEFVGR